MGRGLLRALSLGLVAGATTRLAVAALRARGAEARHGWDALGLDWLTVDAWARDGRSWLFAGAVAALVIVLASVTLGPVDDPRAGTPRRALTRLGRPWLAAVALFVAWLPNVMARVLRPTPPADTPNLLFVLVDTWRADHAGFLGYERPVSPRLDALAARGVVFERAIAASGWTKPSVATLFTGVMPSVHRAISQPVAGLSVRGIQLPPQLTTFVEILAARGWDTGMWSNNPNILPERGFGQGAQHFADYFHRRTPERDAGRSESMLPEVEDWLAQRGERPFCAYVHVMDPHFPYVAPPPFAGTFDRSGLDFQLTGPVIEQYLSGERSTDDITEAMRQRIVDIYDEELLYVDHHLGPFLEQVLAERPNTLIVLVGDHGEEFLEHGQLGHSHSLYEELVHVPLVLIGPGLEPARVPAQVRLMDVMPTVLALLGVDDATPPDVEGESLLPLITGAETGDRPAPMETGGDERPAWQWRALSDGRTKWIRREVDLPTTRPLPALSPRDLGERPYDMLFDLADDPGETKDLAGERPDDVERLYELMRSRGWWHSPEKVLELRASEVDVDADDLDALRRLGYAGDDDDR